MPEVDPVLIAFGFVGFLFGLVVWIFWNDIFGWHEDREHGDD